MARRKSIVCWLALIGVLLNAALVVRHNARMLETRLAPQSLDQSLEASLAVICHGGSEALSDPAGAVPGAPARAPGGLGECPICMGSCPAVAVMWQPPLIAPVRLAASERVVVIAEVIAPRIAGVLPPPRGPPHLA